MTSHNEKIRKWREFAERMGWKGIKYPAPHEWLIMKLTGVECPPTLFWPPWLIGMMSGIFWGVFWGLFMHFTVGQYEVLSRIAIPSIIGGICFGLAMALFHLYRKRKVGLTTWKKFIDDQNDLNRTT